MELIPHPKQIRRNHKQTLVDEFLLGEGSAKAAQTLYEIMCNEKAPSGVRVTAAVALLDRAGYTAKRHETKDLGELDVSTATPAQLRQALAEIDLELAERATDITPVVVPDDGPHTSQAFDFVE